MQNLVPIGRFSTLCLLTVKALRQYDDLGLLRPAMVDPDSGHYYYSVAQALDPERIRLLRSLDVPLEEIRAILSTRDPTALRAHLDRHRQRVEGQIAQYQHVLASLQRLIEQEDEVMAHEVKVKQVVTQPMLSICTRTSLAQIGAVRLRPGTRVSTARNSTGRSDRVSPQIDLPESVERRRGLSPPSQWRRGGCGKLTSGSN